MHKGSFAPANTRFPTYENEDEDISTVQEEQEGEERIKMNQLMEQLDAATLKTARRRDEFEIRDIRRRLGLPIVNDTFMEDAYASTKHLKVCSCQNLLIQCYPILNPRRLKAGPTY